MQSGPWRLVARTQNFTHLAQHGPSSLQLAPNEALHSLTHWHGPYTSRLCTALNLMTCSDPFICQQVALVHGGTQKQKHGLASIGSSAAKKFTVNATTHTPAPQCNSRPSKNSLALSGSLPLNAGCLCRATRLPLHHCTATGQRMTDYVESM